MIQLDPLGVFDFIRCGMFHQQRGSSSSSDLKTPGPPLQVKSLEAAVLPQVSQCLRGEGANLGCELGWKPWLKNVVFLNLLHFFLFQSDLKILTCMHYVFSPHLPSPPSAAAAIVIIPVLPWFNVFLHPECKCNVVPQVDDNCCNNMFC